MVQAARVLIATWFGLDEIGGVSSHIELLTAKLAERGVYCHICSGLGRRSLSVKALAAASSFGSLDRYRHTAIQATLALARSRIREAVSLQRINLIHSHDVYCAFAALDAVRGSGVPIVVTLHGPALSEALTVSAVTRGSRVERMIEDVEARALRCSQHVIAVDSGMGEYARRMGALNVSVVPNAVPSYNCGEAESEDPVFVLVPRRLVPKNGVEFAVRAFATVIDRLPNTILVVAGDGPLRDSLVELSRDLGIHHRVLFFGAIPHSEVLHWISRSAVVLIPSVPVDGVIEATSIAALEAMMAERPVVASSIGGLKEIIVPNVTGVLVPPGNASAIAEGLVRLLTDKTLRQALGRAAGELVSRRYGAELWTDRILSVYSGGLSSHG